MNYPAFLTKDKAYKTSIAQNRNKAYSNEYDGADLESHIQNTSYPEPAIVAALDHVFGVQRSHAMIKKTPADYYNNYITESEWESRYFDEKLLVDFNKKTKGLL